MKKILIASTALVAAGLMTTGTASASDKIKLQLGGFSKWWVVGAWQDNSFEAGVNRGYTNVDVKGDNEIFFGGETTLDNGMKVGVTVELEAGGGPETSAASSATTDVIDKSFVFIEGGFGKFIIGSEANGVQLLHVMAPDAAANWGGEAWLQSGATIVTPAAFSGAYMKTTEIDTDDNADKITYVAPTFYGLTVGASYIPNSAGNGTKGQDNYNQAASESAYGVGAGYANTFGPVGVKLSTGYVWGDANAIGVTADFHELSAGGQLTYGDFTVGGSYRTRAQDEKGGQFNGSVAAGGSVDSHAWDAGIQWAKGPWAVSFAYFTSEIEDGAAIGEDKLEVYQVSAKYTLGAGVDLLGSVGHAEWDDEAAKAGSADANHNKGWAVMTGIGLTF